MNGTIVYQETNIQTSNKNNMNDHSSSLNNGTMANNNNHHHNQHHHQNSHHQNSLISTSQNFSNHNTDQQQQQQTQQQNQPRTLYVGNLDPEIQESFIHTLFSPYGRIIGLKLISDNVNDLYCFIEYDDHYHAATAMQTMNKRQCLGREIKVNWAANSSGISGGGNAAGGIGSGQSIGVLGSAGNNSKQDTSRHFHIFVGDLSSEIETQQLREAFRIFGEISDCRVVRDPQTLKSKGYGFVSFVKQQDAENAIVQMNGQWLGHRPIRTNWATRKIGSGQSGSSLNNHSGGSSNMIGPNASQKPLSFDEVYNQSSITNCTVYCGGIMNGLTEEIIDKHFQRFGSIQEIRVFKDKGYAFIKFASKEAATNAIVLMHNQEILGQTVKCSWGKETIDSAAAVAAAAAAAISANHLGLQSPLIYSPYGNHHQHPQQQQQMYNWYSLQAAAAAQAVAAATGHQPTSVAAAAQYAASLQYPPYNQYYSTTAAGTAGTAASQSAAAAAAAAYQAAAAMHHHHPISAAAWTPTAAAGGGVGSGAGSSGGHQQITNHHHHANNATHHHHAHTMSVPIHHQAAAAAAMQQQQQPQQPTTASAAAVMSAYAMQGYQAQ